MTMGDDRQADNACGEHPERIPDNPNIEHQDGHATGGMRRKVETMPDGRYIIYYYWDDGP